MTKTLDKPATAPTFDWRFYKDWFFRVWSAVRNIDITATNNGNTQIDGNLTVTGTQTIQGNLTGMPLSLLAAAAGQESGNGGQFISAASIGYLPYTLSFTGSTGAYGIASSAAFYYQVGKLVYINASVSINSFSAAGNLVINTPPGLPIVITNAPVLVGRENGISGYELQAIASSTTTFTIFKYDNSASVTANGDAIIVSGCYLTT